MDEDNNVIPEEYESYTYIFVALIASSRDVDVTFFVASVDLWSADGTQEQNLVLNNLGGERPQTYVPRRSRKSTMSQPTYPQQSVLYPDTPVQTPQTRPYSQISGRQDEVDSPIAPVNAITHMKIGC
jgi:hypothetical protein